MMTAEKKEEAFVSSLYSIIFEYQKQPMKVNEENLEQLRKTIIAQVNIFFAGSENLIQRNMAAIKDHTNIIVKNINDKYSRSFIRRWVDKLIDIVTGKKQSRYDNSISNASKNIELLFSKDNERIAGV